MVRSNKKKIKRPWFEHNPAALQHVREVLRTNFPNLHALVDGGRVIIRGSMPIMHEGKELDRYQLKIVLPDDHPHGPVAVYETAKRIPKKADDWHVNPDGSLCLGVPEQVWPSRSKPLDLVAFLNGPVRSFLLRNSIIARGGEWPHGEWDHGAEGIFQYYEERIGISDRAAIIEFMKCLIHPSPKGHWGCPCGSGERLRHCHRDLVQKLREEIPTEALNYSLKIIQSQRAR
jgi:hypothetical protein